MSTPVSALRAVAHPVRLRMLSLLTGTPMSAADLARELAITHANASYHLRQLVAAGQVVEAGQRQIRGGVAKLYRYPHDVKAPRSRSSVEDNQRYAQALFHEVQRRLADRAEKPGSRSSDLEGWVDPDTWQRALGLLEEASTLLHDANQPPGTAGTVHVSFSTWAFRMRPS